jgi:V/A-type H+-transporting ATPase subunit E
MTGLDKILSQISSKAQESADAQIASARQQAEDIIKEMEAKAEQESERIKQQNILECQNIIARAESSAALQKRKAILSSKQKIIGEIINKAKQYAVNLPEQEYFQLIGKMVLKHALPQDGIIVFSKRDKDRLPLDFEEELNRQASSIGGTLTLSKETRTFEGGFILIYGDIEVNCTFESLFESRLDILQDKLNKFLFA